MNKRLVLPVLLAGLALALGGAGYGAWTTWGSSSAVASATGDQPAGRVAISDGGETAHDCDGHAGGQGDQDHHDSMMGGGAAGDDNATPGAGDGHMQGADHDSMMREHHGTGGSGASGGGEPDGMMGGGT